MKDAFNKSLAYVKSHPKFFFWLRIVVTVALFALILSTLNLSKLGELLLHANPLTIFIAFLLIALHVSIKSYKWFLLIRTVDKENTFRSALFSYLHGTGLAIVTPARVGELARVFYLKGDKIKLTSLTVVDKVFELFAVIALVLAGSLEFIKNSYVIGGIVAALFIFVLALFNFKRLSLYFEKKVPMPSVQRALEGIRALPSSVIVIISILSIGVMLVYLLQVWLIMSGFISVSFGIIFSVFPLVLLTNLVPFTTASIGVRESAAIFLLAHFGIASEVAVSTTTLILLFDTVVPGLVGSIGAGDITMSETVKT
jgi:uncharacterized membrane protein YbhN (UPF0104 family)